MVNVNGKAITFARGDHVDVPFNIGEAGGSHFVLTAQSSESGQTLPFDITAGQLLLTSAESMTWKAGGYTYNVVELYANGERVELMSGGTITVSEVIG